MHASTLHSLSTIIDVLQGHEFVVNSLPLEKAFTFIVLARHLKPRIALGVSTVENEAPDALPRSVHGFLCTSLDIEHELGKLCWQALRDFVWAAENSDGQVLAYADLFLRFGVDFEVGE